LLPLLAALVARLLALLAVGARCLRRFRGGHGGPLLQALLRLGARSFSVLALLLLLEACGVGLLALLGA
jgi:hypothetical protein